MMTFEMKEKIRDAKTKILVLHRFIHSKHPDDIQVVETNKQLLFPDKNKLDESDLKMMVEFMYETIPSFSIRVPESTIVIICQNYFHLTNYKILNDRSIFEQLDKQRPLNPNHLSNFGKQELNLKNYIMHVMMNESRELMNNGLDINIFEEQIDVAIEYFTNADKRSEIITKIAIEDFKDAAEAVDAKKDEEGIFSRIGDWFKK